MRRAFSGTVIGVLLVGFLASCTGGGKEPPGLTASPSATAESPSASPTPVDAPIDRSDPDLGIVFTDLPEVTGDARSALDMLTLFEVEVWRALNTGTYAPSIALIASPEVAAIVKAQVDGNAERGWTIDGLLRVTTELGEVDDLNARATVCEDFAEGIFTNEGVTYTAEEVDLMAPTKIDLTLSRSGDAESSWTVTGYTPNGTC